MRVIYEKAALKGLRAMPPKLAQTLQRKLADFAANPHQAHAGLDVQRMAGMVNGWRLRQGGWRALFYLHADVMVVTEIGTRGGIYK